MSAQQTPVDKPPLQLPTVQGSNLARQKMTFPADFAGRVNMVFIPFQQWQQSQVDSWVPLAEELSQAFSDFHYYEFPTIQRMNWLSRSFINEGMRAGIRDEATRARTITLYLDKAGFKQALDIPGEETTWVMLFDRQGRLLWRTSGAYTPEKGRELQEAVAARLDASPD